MTTSREYIESRAPHFATNSELDTLIDCASGELSDTAFGDLRYKAVALLVCHWLALRARDENHHAVSGQITSEKTGRISRAYGGGFFSGTVQSTLDPYLAQTSWGVELFYLQQSTIPRVFSGRM